jgi:hypothetical protein
MRTFILLCFLGLPLSLYAQQRELKAIQPSLAELMMFEIRLNPADTIFSYYDFSYLPVKGFPLFTADPSMPFYTVAQRDSIVRKLDGLFFEQ